MILKFLKIFAVPLVVLVTALLFLVLDLYRYVTWMDIPLHFVGAASLAVSYYLVLRMLKTDLTGLVLFLSVVFLVLATGVLWEFLEFSVDLIYPALKMQPSVADTVGDLFLDFIGGIVGALWMYLKGELIP
jgi:hypothetical protein